MSRRSRTPLLLALLTAAFLPPSSLVADEVIYSSPNKIDAVRVTGANRRERKAGTKHPHEFGPEQIRGLLRSIRFSKQRLVMKDVSDDRLFEERHVEFLAPYLIEAFGKAGPGEVVEASFFTRESKYGLTNDRLTIFRAYVNEEGLHMRFEKLYAKLLGDRTTKGLQRSVNEARGMRVQLQPGPGQALVSSKPPELVFDLGYDFVKGAPPEAPPLPEGTILMKTHKKDAEGMTVRERLKELDRLREEELITEKEYQKKRKELIQQL